MALQGVDLQILRILIIRSINGVVQGQKILFVSKNKAEQHVLILPVDTPSKAEYFIQFKFQFVFLSLYGFLVYPARPENNNHRHHSRFWLFVIMGIGKRNCLPVESLKSASSFY